MNTTRQKKLRFDIDEDYERSLILIEGIDPTTKKPFKEWTQDDIDYVLDRGIPERIVNKYPSHHVKCCYEEYKYKFTDMNDGTIFVRHLNAYVKRLIGTIDRLAAIRMKRQERPNRIIKNDVVIETSKQYKEKKASFDNLDSFAKRNNLGVHQLSSMVSMGVIDPPNNKVIFDLELKRKSSDYIEESISDEDIDFETVEQCAWKAKMQGGVVNLMPNTTVKGGMVKKIRKEKDIERINVSLYGDIIPARMVWSSNFSQCIRKEQEEECSSDIEIENSDCSIEFNNYVIENNEGVEIVSSKTNAFITFDKELERCINQIQYVVTKDTSCPLDPYLGSNQSRGLGSCDIASKTTHDVDTLLYDAIYDALIYDDSSLRKKFGVSVSLPNRHPLWMNVNDMRFNPLRGKTLPVYDVLYNRLFDYGLPVRCQYDFRNHREKYYGYTSLFMDCGNCMTENDIKHLVGMATLRDFIGDNDMKQCITPDWECLNKAKQGLFALFMGNDLSKKELGIHPRNYEMWQDGDAGIFQNHDIFRDEFEIAYILSKFEICRTLIAVAIENCIVETKGDGLVDEWLVFLLKRALIERRNLNIKFTNDLNANKNWFDILRNMTQYELFRVFTYSSDYLLKNYVKKFVLVRILDEVIENLIAYLKDRHKLFSICFYFKSRS